MEATQFKTEAEQLAKIKHENIITVYGHSSQNDNYVIVMEFAEGGALAACKCQLYHCSNLQSITDDHIILSDYV